MDDLKSGVFLYSHTELALVNSQEVLVKHR